MDKDNLPAHIAIIMDGNRRWAKAQGKPASFGHKEGAKTLENIVRYANKIGIKYITVYAFSTENWKRTTEEVNALMTLFQSYLDYYSKKADSENIKVKIVGSREGLSEKMKESIENCMERTKKQYRNNIFNSPKLWWQRRVSKCNKRNSRRSKRK